MRDVDKLRDAPSFKWKNYPSPQFVVIAVDPNSGGSSDTAFVAMCPVNGQYVVSPFFYLYIVVISLCDLMGHLFLNY